MPNFETSCKYPCSSSRGMGEANTKGNIKGAVQNKLTSTNYSKYITL